MLQQLLSCFLLREGGIDDIYKLTVPSHQVHQTCMVNVVIAAILNRYLLSVYLECFHTVFQPLVAFALPRHPQKPRIKVQQVLFEDRGSVSSWVDRNENNFHRNVSQCSEVLLHLGKVRQRGWADVGTVAEAKIHEIVASPQFFAAKGSIVCPCQAPLSSELHSLFWLLFLWCFLIALHEQVGGGSSDCSQDDHGEWVIDVSPP